MKGKHASPISVAQSLQHFVRSRFVELTNACPSIRDWPGCGAHLDLSLLRGAKQLAAEGRTCAAELAECRLVRQWSDGENTWFLIPKTLLQEVRPKEAAGAKPRRLAWGAVVVLRSTVRRIGASASRVRVRSQSVP